MTVTYDQYYQKENLFGQPYRELIEFLSDYPEKGKVLDLGCGQGRDAIALARLGYAVTGLDNSKVGIMQMNRIAKDEKLNLTGLVENIYSFDKYNEYDIILLDSMLHFTKKEREREIELVRRIVSKAKCGALIIFCIQDTGNKVQTLEQAIDFPQVYKRLEDKKFRYLFEDEESGHRSESDYRMLIIEK